MKVYPRWKYHRIHGGKIVANAKEEAALGDGWTDNYGVVTNPVLIEQIRIASTPAPPAPEPTEAFLKPALAALEQSAEKELTTPKRRGRPRKDAA